MINTKQNDFYLARNKDGFLCSYDSKTHKCLDVLLSTGDNVALYEKNYKSYIGQTDPKFEESDE